MCMMFYLCMDIFVGRRCVLDGLTLHQSPCQWRSKKEIMFQEMLLPYYLSGNNQVDRN